MSEEMLWPRGVRQDVRDAQLLLDFIRKEILTLEFVQAVDPDVEPELAKTVAHYRRVIKQIEEAITVVEKGV